MEAAENILPAVGLEYQNIISKPNDYMSLSKSTQRLS